jgi:transporter family-2 protein
VMCLGIALFFIYSSSKSKAAPVEQSMKKAIVRD